MKLDVKYDTVEYKTENKQPELKPTIVFDRNIICVFNTGYDMSYGVVTSMFCDYVHKHENYEVWNGGPNSKEWVIGDISKSFTRKVEIKSPKQLFEYLPYSMHSEEDMLGLERVSGDECFFDGYKVFIYPNSLERNEYDTPEAREARMSTISIINNTVTFGLRNVFKYYEWDEILYDVAGIRLYDASNSRSIDDTKEEVKDISKKYSFTLITDLESCNGITGLFDMTLAGVLTNEETKTKTIFNKHQAIHIWYWLYSLCQQFDDRWYHSGEDYELESIAEHNPYVDEFVDRLDLLDSLDDLSTLMYMIGDGYYSFGKDDKIVEYFNNKEEQYESEYFSNKKSKSLKDVLDKESGLCSVK